MSVECRDMNIDAHQHFWNYDPVKDTWITEEMKAIRRSFLPKDLKMVLKENEIDGSVVVQAAPTEEETDFLLELAAKNDFIKGVVGWVDFTSEKIEERLQYYKKESSKLKGFRHLVQDEPDEQFLLREDFCNGINLLQKYDFTYDILIYPKQLPAAIEFVKRFPNQKFVVDHMAKPCIKAGTLSPWDEHMKELAEYPKVYCKLSGIITEADWHKWTEKELISYLDVVFDAFSSDRLMFGSDWPVCLVAGNYRKVKQIITHYMQVFSGREQQAVMGQNAIKFYQL